MNCEETKVMYKKIFEVIDKYSNDCVLDIKSLKYKSECHLYGLKLKEVYGLNIDEKKVDRLEFLRFGDYLSISLYGQEHLRTISCSDDGKQPENELLLQISFPSGAYIFEGDYPTDLFYKLFMELKTYNPKYSDTHNNNLYFTMDNAKDVFNAFPKILEKYNDLNKEDYKKRKILKLEKELKSLQ